MKGFCMARSVRIEFPGAYYHVMARGNRRQRIFRDDADWRGFLGVLGEACERTGWWVHAWVLMGNHYHLLVETPEGNLVEGMKWLQNTYTRRFNCRHGLWGRMFGDRYKSVLVEGAQPYYYETLMDYIHLNPVRAGLVDVAGGGSVLDYLWSSVAGAYALMPGKRPPWVAAARGLEMLGCADTAAGRRKFVERLDRRALAEGPRGAGTAEVDAEMDRRRSHLRRGWYWGSQAFGEMLLGVSRKAVRERGNASYRSGPLAKAHDMAEAQRIVEEGKRALGLGDAELETTRGNDPRKVALADVLLRRTGVGQRWIAERLGMKSAANVCQAVRRLRLREFAGNDEIHAIRDILSDVFD